MPGVRSKKSRLSMRVRVELAHASELIEVKLARERADTLSLTIGQQVWIKTRKMRVFPVTQAVINGGGRLRNLMQNDQVESAVSTVCERHEQSSKRLCFVW